jgi:hypothetical protein
LHNRGQLGMDTQLVENGTDVSTAGVDTDVELSGDAFGLLPLGEEVEDLPLAGRELGCLGAGAPRDFLSRRKGPTVRGTGASSQN